MGLVCANSTFTKKKLTKGGKRKRVVLLEVYLKKIIGTKTKKYAIFACTKNIFNLRKNILVFKNNNINYDKNSCILLIIVTKN